MVLPAVTRAMLVSFAENFILTKQALNGFKRLLTA